MYLLIGATGGIRLTASGPVLVQQPAAACKALAHGPWTLVRDSLRVTCEWGKKHGDIIRINNANGATPPHPDATAYALHTVHPRTSC